MPPGRPAQFDRSEVLARAMDYFWTNGYRAGGIAELLDIAGVGRQTLYSAFGSKRGLFIEVIAYYRATHLRPVLETLARGGSPVQNISEAVGFFERLALDKRARGCLVANALVEIGSDDLEVHALLEETLGMLEKALLIALQRAQAAGELPTSKNPRSLSRALTNAMMGMAVTGRLGKGKAVIADIYAGTLEMLN